MTKIVINTRFGGFGLSVLAQKEILELKGIKAYPYYWDSYSPFEPTEYYRANHFEGSSFITWLKYDPKKDSFTDEEPIDISEAFDFNKFDFHQGNRSDSELVQAVEKLGELADGSHAELEVVEIPDGYEYMISEYDGLESVYYGKDLYRL